MNLNTPEGLEKIRKLQRVAAAGVALVDQWRQDLKKTQVFQQELWKSVDELQDEKTFKPQHLTLRR